MENTSLDYYTIETMEIDGTGLETGTETHSGQEVYNIPFHHRAIVASVLIGLTLIGLFGNTLVIIAVVVAKKLRTITNILVVNLAFADLVTCLCIPFQVVGLLSQTEGYPLHDFVCATVAGVTITCILCSCSTLAVIAIDRWYVITKFVRGQRGIHSPTKIATLVVIIWIGSVALTVVPTVLGMGTLGYAQYYGLCLTTDTNLLDYYYVALQGTVIAVILTLTVIFYVLILRHVLQHNKRFRDKYDIKKDNSSHAAQSKDSSVSRESCPPMIQSINRKEIQITKNLFMVVCAFVFCFLANSMILIIPGDSVFALYTNMLVVANSVVNPIIYGLKHPNFQEVFKRNFCCHCSEEVKERQREREREKEER